VLPKAVYPSATAKKLGGEDRTFNRLDRTHRQMPVEIKIDSTDFRTFIARDLFFDLWRAQAKHASPLGLEALRLAAA
jgi:hypothetical protein